MLKKLGKKFAQVQEPLLYAHFLSGVFGGRNMQMHGGRRNVHSMEQGQRSRKIASKFD
jgi:hypothetical protein